MVGKGASLGWSLPMMLHIDALARGWILFAVVTSLTLPVGPTHGQDSATDADEWAKELAALADDWRAAAAAGNRLVGLPPDEGLAILQQNWSKLSVPARQQMLKAFHSSEHPHRLAVIHLGMTDSAAKVRSWASRALKGIAFRDFTDDSEGYATWYAANRERPLTDIQEEGLRALAVAAGKANGEVERKRIVDILDSGYHNLEKPELRNIALEHDLHRMLFRWLTEPGGDRLSLALNALAGLDLDDDFLRDEVLPLVRQDTPAVARRAAVSSIGHAECDWAVEPLVTRLREVSRQAEPTQDALRFCEDIAEALGEIGDPAAVPAMIEIIEAHPCYETIYGVGYSGLGKITGVEYDESHDGAWWRKWWAENQERVIKEARGAAELLDAEDVAEIPVEDLRAGGNQKMRYALIGPKPGAKEPADGWRLLVVLPGGSADHKFHPFVKRILKNALPDNYLIAQPIAVRWTRRQARRLVWPSERNMMPRVGFSTEQFVTELIRDVQKRRKIDARYVFTLGWSSGGPPCYAISLQEQTPVTGTFVAMSVFQPNKLPPLERAKGRSFYLLHSPEDWIPIGQAEQARDALRRHGARVELTTYPGGHGWRGGTYTMIRSGVEWLEAQCAGGRPQQTSPSP